jgi:hypothetical protein
MSSPVPVPTPPRILRLFISYASEDLNLAAAIARGMRNALGDFSEVNFDQWSLQAGEQFKKQLATKLTQTDILIVIYTGSDQRIGLDGYTAWEVGFFEGVMRASPEGKSIIPMYLESAPDTVAAYQGVGLKIQRDLLHLSASEFETRNDVRADDPMCQLIQKLQETVDRYTEEAGLPRSHNRTEPLETFRAMRLEIFQYLKNRVETTLKPQKQITIRTSGPIINNGDVDLPPDAKLAPNGVGNPMDIFGLQNDEITWEKFLQSIPAKHRDSWRVAIASVVTSSLQGINVDNSQVILSRDESRSYRVILTTASRYFNGNQEFSLYFVESLQRGEYGDKDTTLLLKGLELVCRYRFLFLETDSKFSANSILVARTERLPDIAGELLRELNLMKKDSLNAGLDQAGVWALFVDWDNIQQMTKNYEPAEQAIRGLISEILKVRDKPEDLVRLREQLSGAVKQLTTATGPQNSLLIKAMSQKLQSLVQSEQVPNP